MKTSDVPDEENRMLDGQRKAVYARDASGRHVIVGSTGWKVEETVTQLAIDSFREQAAAALAAARRGEASPLAYHMYRLRMDLPTLAQSAGVAAWRVRRHLRAKPYRGLSASLKQRYADALGVTPVSLDELPDA